MITTALRSAYEKLFETASIPDLGEAGDGGWTADKILAHLLSVDAAIAAVALGVVSGSRPSFDNRISLDSWNLNRIIAAHSGRSDLIDHVRNQATILCDFADQLSAGVDTSQAPANFANKHLCRIPIRSTCISVHSPFPCGTGTRLHRRPPSQPRPHDGG
ncbi:hypothetical protein SAMN05216368_1244 [Cryobacterium flavum]|uniref:Mycothiol-dependent maleylpyruvate isomerase metal-binding domain-containing protein n=1 Tax=Cryobacterium flavum TaxID=1424659 RepID=A0A5E9G3M6_9MICO|nr:hypothetical protein SAMN05216368_1244 [Cryobacterium flavum]